MPTTNRVAYDAELVAISRLRAEWGGGIPALGTSLGSTLPAVTVSAAGGAPLREGVLDEARLDVNGWAGTRLAALDLCTKAVGLLVVLEGWNAAGWTAEGVQVTRCRTVLRPTYSFDPVAQKPRYTATVALTARTT